MEIDVLKLIPEEWSIEELDDVLIKITRPAKGSGTYCKPIIIRKSIHLTEDFVAGIAMYLGDGKLAKDGHLAYASKDIDIIQFMLKFFEEHINICKEDISFYLYYKNDQRLNLWLETLQISEDKIRIYQSNRYRYSCVNFQIGSVLLRKLFGNIIEGTLKLDLVDNKKLRRAFLRGLFAAEGSVGVQRTEKPRPYINAIGFHFHENERYLIDYCCKCLDAEEITYQTVNRPNFKTTYIAITNWNNYWRLWRTNIFDLCKRKKDTFINVASSLKVGCLLEKTHRKELFSNTNLYQRDLAKQLGTYQASICRMIRGEFYPTIEQVIKLSKLTNTNIETIKENIQESRAGHLTNIIDPEFVDFMFDLKSV
jgi:plasmid maintenance system antidote protein VapI